MASKHDPGPPSAVSSNIRLVRGMRVILDRELAALYDVQTKRLNEAVRRNSARFPADFAFKLEAHEYEALKSQIATSKGGRGGRRKLPWAFTEHGALMVATILNSPRAIQMSVYVVRAFVQFRTALNTNPQLAVKLMQLERSLARLDGDTQRKFEEVYEAIRALASTPSGSSRPIGFTADID